MQGWNAVVVRLRSGMATLRHEVSLGRLLFT